MRKISTHLILFFLFSAVFVSAQQPVIRESENEFDQKYTPAKGSIFNDLGVTRNSKSSESEVNIKNSIKFIPTAMFRQKILFTYQREIYKGFSAGLVLGKAFGRDYIQELGLELFDTNFDSDILSTGNMVSGAKYDGSSPWVGLNLRVYFSGKSFDGVYVEFNYSNERIDYVLDPQVDGYDVKGVRNAEIKMNALGLTFGGTYTTSHFSHELWFTTGIKLFKATQFVRYTPPNSTGYSSQYFYKSGIENEILVPTFSFGYAMGFGF